VFRPGSPALKSDRRQMLDKRQQRMQRIALPAVGIDLHFVAASDGFRLIQRVNAMIGTTANWRDPRMASRPQIHRNRAFHNPERLYRICFSHWAEKARVSPLAPFWRRTTRRPRWETPPDCPITRGAPLLATVETANQTHPPT
jgi:hypothetical protein